MTDNKLHTAIDLMIRTDHMHRTLVDTRVREIGIPHTQHRILIYIHKHSPLTSQKEIADFMNITPAAVTGALQKLEMQGYIERALAKDNRYNEITITEKGRELLKVTCEAFQRIDRALFSGFSEEELDSYIACLTKMQNNLKVETRQERVKRDEKMV